MIKTRKNNTKKNIKNPLKMTQKRFFLKNQMIDNSIFLHIQLLHTLKQHILLKKIRKCDKNSKKYEKTLKIG